MTVGEKLSRMPNTLCAMRYVGSDGKNTDTCRAGEPAPDLG